jgi:hypothetical protein
VGPPRWYAVATFPGREPPEVPEDARLVITVGSEVGAGGRADVMELDAPEG